MAAKDVATTGTSQLNGQHGKRTPRGGDQGERRDSVHLFTLCHAVPCYNVVVPHGECGHRLEGTNDFHYKYEMPHE